MTIDEALCALAMPLSRASALKDQESRTDEEKKCFEALVLQVSSGFDHITRQPKTFRGLKLVKAIDKPLTKVIRYFPDETRKRMSDYFVEQEVTGCEDSN